MFSSQLDTILIKQTQRAGTTAHLIIHVWY